MYDLSKYIIWVYRISNQTNDLKFKQSKPCNTCCTFLSKLGFQRIMYINDHNDIEQLDLRYVHNNHLSNAQKKLSKYCRICC